MDVERLKKKRTSVRQLFSKLLTKIENTIDAPLTDAYSKEQKLEDIYEHYSQLEEKIKNLKGLDSEIEALISIEEIDNEIVTSEEYFERGIKVKTKLNRILEILVNPPRKENNVEINSNPSSSSSGNGAVRSTEHGNVCSFRLPKLMIKPYGGEISQWIEFWSQYDGAIHSNETLSKVEKFQYLKSLCIGSAFNAISGLAMSEQNYEIAVEILRDRYGRSDLTIGVHMNKLIDIEPVRNSSNVIALRKLYDQLECNVRCLETLKVVSGSYGQLLSPILMKKLPDDLALEYNRRKISNTEFDVSELMSFIKKEVECREASFLLSGHKNSGNDTRYRDRPTVQNKQGFVQKRNFYTNNIATASTLSTTAKTINETCIFCSEKSHKTENCPLTVTERKNSLKTNSRCFVCLKKGTHTSKVCFKRHQSCPICLKFAHNYLICEQTALKPSESKPKEQSSVLSTVTVPTQLLHVESENENINSPVLLQTFTACIENEVGRHNVRVMIDGGSNRSFIETKTAESLGLKVIRRETLQIYAFGDCREGNRQNTYDVVQMVLQNRVQPNKKLRIEAVVIDKITQGHIEIPSPWIRNVALKRGIELADIGTSKQVNILIGADYLWDILYEKNIRIGKRLVVTESMFGFIIQGRESEVDSKGEIFVNHITVERESDYERVKTLWELEAIGVSQNKEISLTDDEVMKIFEQNTSFLNNRYETRLLWKDNCNELNSNYEIAEKRLMGLNNKFRKNPDLYYKYKEIIEDQLREGIIEEVNGYSDEDKHKGYFMPHHAVIRELKESTKVRIVFDASSRAKNEKSLNDCLDSGPSLNPDLLQIILQFRFQPIAFCADIERAFLEVGINEEERKFLQFLWGGLERETNLGRSDRSLRILRMKRVPFGVKCSPFLLNATIRLHISKYEKTHKKAVDMLKKLYVDDLISGTSTLEEAMAISKDVSHILKEASMNLRQWASNSTILQEFWKENQMECRKASNDSLIPLKVLGLIWDNDKDTLKIELNQGERLKKVEPTKRNILGACGILFDPLGMITPFTVRIKIIMQMLWEKGIDWDETISLELQLMFKEWVNEIEELKNLVVPRPYFMEPDVKAIEVHIFSDASLKAYGSVAYFKIRYLDICATSFVISKSRLAPLKKLTLPRLELLGTLISARLASYLLKTFPSISESNVFLWTDSQICLHWIKGEPNEWKQFVRNRVLEIREKTDPLKWNFCDGRTNPADKLTRGISARALIKDDVWWKGPSWLLEDDILRDDLVLNPELYMLDTEREKRTNGLILHTCVEFVNTLLNLNNFSNLNKVLRITAYVLRFVNNATPNAVKRSGTLSVAELMLSEVVWVKSIQQQEFPKEYRQLQSKTSIDKDSKLIGLNPMLSSDGTLHLCGRLQHSEFQFQQKHPWILPNKSRFSELLIMREHENLCHAGVNDTLTQIREKYWILRGRQAVKSCLNKCLVCRKYRVTRGKQVVAPLPPSRTHSEHAFEIVGIDFAGPLYTRDLNKVYIALFTCATTRAIHLEIVSSLSTEHFLLSFRRFVARRGLCRTINSDNALTFKCADSELKKLYGHLKEPAVLEFFGKKGIAWQYIVEKAAWWGGYWERMVRITKIALRKVLGRSMVSVEELQTLLTEIEAIINSRPLTYVYNEPNEPFPLTPAHFLVGKRLTVLPQWTGNTKPIIIDSVKSSTKKVLLKRYLYREKLLNTFWKRWRGEYLLQLKGANYVKPVSVNCKFNKNDLVLVGEEKIPRNMWRMARIIDTHKGRDGQVRSATIKTSTGIIKRPIQLLFHLEIDNHETGI